MNVTSPAHGVSEIARVTSRENDGGGCSLCFLGFRGFPFLGSRFRLRYLYLRFFLRGFGGHESEKIVVDVAVLALRQPTLANSASISCPDCHSLRRRSSFQVRLVPCFSSVANRRRRAKRMASADTVLWVSPIQRIF